MSSIFTKIIQGEIPSFKIAESEDYLAFLDIRPLAQGHTLVVPKKEVDYIFDLDDETLSGLHLFSKKVAHALRSCIDCKRVGMLVVGTEVPHAHVHLIPFRQEAQMAINALPMKFPNEEMQATANKVNAKFKELYG